MVQSSWISLIEKIQNGEPVAASIANRAVTQLAQRTDYLKDLVDAVVYTQNNIHFNAAVSPEVVAGMAVYWNPSTLEYAPALAALEPSGASQYGDLAASSYVAGICVSKPQATAGTVCLNGRYESIDLSGAIDTTIAAGPYFLSTTEAGKLVTSEPQIGIQVLIVTETRGATETDVIVAPQPRNLLESHVHYKLTLTMDVIIDDADEGWLVAAHPAFSGTAPVGAVYGYNIAADTDVADAFPFYPPEQAYLELDAIGGNSKVVVNMNGIWWIDSNYGPDDFNAGTLYYTKMIATSGASLVRSLQPYGTSPIEIVDCYGNSAQYGDLFAKLNLTFTESGETEEGWLAYKTLLDSSRFVRGPIVESVVSGDPRISVTIRDGNGYDWSLSDAAEKGVSGQLVLSYNDPSNLVNEGTASLVTFNNARQEEINGSPVIEFPAGFDSSIMFRFDIPTTGLSDDLYFQFWVWVTNSVVGSIPAVTVTYKVLSAADGTAQQAIPAAESSITLTAAPAAITVAGAYVLASTPASGAGAMLATPGSQVYVTVSRDSSGVGDMSIVRHGYKVIGG